MRKAHERLTDEQRLFIIRHLARYEGTTETAKLFKDRFGFEITPQRCDSYDPTKFSGRHLSADHRAYFLECRREAQENTDDIGICHRTYRLTILDRILQKCLKNGNLKMAMDTLKQAADEMSVVEKLQRPLLPPRRGMNALPEDAEVEDVEQPTVEGNIDSMLHAALERMVQDMASQAQDVEYRELPQIEAGEG